jgi:hypothetical protein
MSQPGSEAAKQHADLAKSQQPNTNIASCEGARKLHSSSLPGVVYGMALIPILGKEGGKDASAYARDVISRMEPRDPAEEMLVAQMLFAHARVLRLTELTQDAATPDALRVIHEYADRASNTYRRLMLALADYRRPFRSGDTIAVMQQANIASQQVIHTNEIRTNEQGIERCIGAGSPANPGNLLEAAPTISSESAGTGLPQGFSEVFETMGIVHRAKDRKR